MFYLLLLTFQMGCEQKSTETDTAVEDSASTTAEPSSDTTTADSGEPEELPPIDADFTIDATDSTSWIYFNLADRSIVEPSTPEDSTEWDLKFQRYEIGINGGVSGTAEVMVLAQEGVYDDYDNIETVPEGTWVTDLEDADGDEKPEYALGEWFNYDSSTHVYTPKDLV